MVTINSRELRYCVEEGTQIYNDEPFTGIARYYNREGKLTGENTYLNGIQHGLARYWYPSGQLKGKETFVNNGLHGPCKEWHENGQLKRDAMFEHSILVRDKQWDENGKLIKDMQLTEKDPLFESLERSRQAHKENNPPK
jgi:antitoxin component YwqK of YwqJK toxin-antitoxin module